MTDDVHTVHLGAYTHEHAEAIAGQLEKAGIAWWYKAPGFFSQIWERSVRLFVDRTRLGEAQAIADRVLAAQPDGDGSSSGQT
ncbi:MAG: hypothetical protein EHM22_01065 [Actinobacteria bacterium]|nr:MAG: hypothetical protein EHM22_01065 [Actinomycetota bacterium]